MYSKKYDSDFIRSNNKFYFEFINKYLDKEFSLVDLGCGTCRKNINIANKVKSIYGIDINEDMLEKAKINIKNSSVENIKIFFGNNFNSPFQNHIFDICTVALTSYSVPEIQRILKPNGILLIETLTAKDKHEIKDVFGFDELGNRGFLSNQSESFRYRNICDSLTPFFEIIEMKKVEWKTKLEISSFVELLEVTPTIRNFSKISDFSAIDSISKNGFVEFTESRYYIAAKSRNKDDEVWDKNLKIY
jgi:SAM-dependent methyltransferase